MGGARRRSVRLLPIGTDHVRRRPARGQRQADRCRHRQRADGQHLPLRDLSTHPCCRPPRGGAGQGLKGAAMSLANVSRRDFLKTSASATGGLIVAFIVPGAGRRAFAQAAPAGKLPPPNAFLRVGSDDTVTVLLAHSEMGQGIWTTLPMLIAEELDADWSRIRVEHAPAAPVYAHAVFGIQMTGGSSSTWSEFDRYRQAGALARALLVEAAAKQFGVEPGAVRTENGEAIAGNQS